MKQGACTPQKQVSTLELPRSHGSGHESNLEGKITHAGCEGGEALFGGPQERLYASWTRTVQDGSRDSSHATCLQRSGSERAREARSEELDGQAGATATPRTGSVAATTGVLGAGKNPEGQRRRIDSP